MKKVLLMMLLVGGTVLTTSAQRGYDRGYRDHGRGHGHGRWDRDDRDDRWERCERPRRVYVRDRYDCYRPQRVVYAEPAYYPAVIPVPVPPPRYYAPRPRAVFHAGVTIVN